MPYYLYSERLAWSLRYVDEGIAHSPQGQTRVTLLSLNCSVGQVVTKGAHGRQREPRAEWTIVTAGLTEDGVKTLRS